MTNNQLTRERIELIANFHRAMTLPPSHDEIEELARMALAAMDSEPVIGKPFMYGIADPDGNAYIDEFCVSEDLGLVEDTVNELNYDREEGDELNYSVVPLYRHAQQPVVPDGYVRDEHGRMMLNGVCEPKIGFGAGWNTCRAAMLQAGNSPVIPDGYVIVPKESTKEMIAAAMNCDDVLFNSDESFCVQFGNIYEAMLAAAHTGIPMNSNGWIPVSERLPENDVSVLTYDGMYKRVQHAMYGHWQGWNSEKITHWVPLPAAPQEVKGE